MTCPTLKTPVFLADRWGREALSLSALLQPAPVTSFVGGGGKTSTILTLAQELCQSGARVIVTTTTHILPVRGELPKGLRIVGTPLPNGKLACIDHPEKLIRECDFLLIEADGSRGLPAKAPADHEPVILPETQLVVAVQGLSAIGHPIEAVCHRPERVCALLHKTPETLFTPEDGAALLMSLSGQRKGVEGRRYAIVLNQADTLWERSLGVETAGFLAEEIPAAITAYQI